MRRLAHHCATRRWGRLVRHRSDHCHDGRSEYRTRVRDLHRGEALLPPASSPHLRARGVADQRRPDPMAPEGWNRAAEDQERLAAEVHVESLAGAAQRAMCHSHLPKTAPRVHAQKVRPNPRS